MQTTQINKSTATVAKVAQKDRVGIEQKASITALAGAIKACADPVRLSILRVLKADSYSVQELCQIFAIKQSALSHHLKLLLESGFLATRREGNSIFYRREVRSIGDDLFNLHHALNALIDQQPLDEALVSGIEQVASDRVAQSKDFFIQNAKKLRKQQDLIASFPQYGESVASFIAHLGLIAKNSDDAHIAIEIGPGEGLFLPFLAEHFSRVLGFDISDTVLSEAHALIQQQALNNVELTLGDTQTALKQGVKAQCVVLNMVLHHVASPNDIFTDCSELLLPGGGLIVTDLCHHDQLWAKEACGDVWLGFEPDDLTQWATNCGLAEGESSYLAQRNGFRIQLRHFYKGED
ncbi:MAG: metalloregulator ArsR/SmtB family transcription factor [Cellvibrionales bacterium]|nr:metalloregulator ArsR/SmtB family transcription factor [Cellvibrionales bacterium]